MKRGGWGWEGCPEACREACRHPDRSVYFTKSYVCPPALSRTLGEAGEEADHVPLPERPAGTRASIAASIVPAWDGRFN